MSSHYQHNKLIGSGEWFRVWFLCFYYLKHKRFINLNSIVNCWIFIPGGKVTIVFVSIDNCFSLGCFWLSCIVYALSTCVICYMSLWILVFMHICICKYVNVHWYFAVFVSMFMWKFWSWKMVGDVWLIIWVCVFICIYLCIYLHINLFGGVLMPVNESTIWCMYLMHVPICI